jgi:hypothetical protein
MIVQRIDLLQVVLFVAALFAPGGSTWADPGACVYPGPTASDEHAPISGTGTGGTGTVAQGSGIGGTGITPQEAKDAMPVAGKVIFSQGSVQAQNNGRSRPLGKGDAVCVGETILTAESATIRIKLADESLVEVRPVSHLAIKKFVYRAANDDVSLLALLKGAARIITGKIGKLHPQNDLVETPTALIGVRGTDHVAAVILPGDKANSPSGTYDTVNSGETFIKTEKGEIGIHPHQVGFAGNSDAAPILLKEMPSFFATDALPSQGSSSGETQGTEAEHPAGRSSEQAAERPAPQGSVPSPHDHSDGHGGVEIPQLPVQPDLPDEPTMFDLPEAPPHIDLPDPHSGSTESAAPSLAGTTVPPGAPARHKSNSVADLTTGLEVDR